VDASGRKRYESSEPSGSSRLVDEWKCRIEGVEVVNGEGGRTCPAIRSHGRDIERNFENGVEVVAGCMAEGAARSGLRSVPLRLALTGGARFALCPSLPARGRLGWKARRGGPR